MISRAVSVLAIASLAGLLAVHPGSTAAAADQAVVHFEVVTQLRAGTDTRWMDTDRNSGRVVAVSAGAPARGEPSRLWVFDGRSGTQLGGPFTLDEPGPVVYEAATNTAYIAQAAGRTVTAINTLTGAVRAKIPTVTSPTTLALDPARQRLYVTSREGSLVAVIDTVAKTLVRMVPLPRATDPDAIAVNLDNHEVYVSRGPGAAVPGVEIIVDGATRADEFVPLDFAPRAFTVADDHLGRSMLVAAGRVTERINIRYRSIERPTVVLSAASVDGWQDVILIGDDDSGTVTMSGLLSPGIRDTMSVPGVSAITGVRWDPGSASVFAVGAGGSSVFVLREVGHSPGWVTSSLPSATVGTAYSEIVRLTGTPTPSVRFSAGSLPPGMTFSPALNSITGRPTSAGRYLFTLVATNGIGGLYYRDYEIVVAAR